MHNYLFFVSDLITNNVAIKTTIAIGSKTNAFWIKAAKTYATKDTAATVIAYGSCVDTWLI